MAAAVLRNLIDRIMTRIVLDPGSGCWHWEGAVAGNGYGYLGRLVDDPPDQSQRVHRLSYELFRGLIPKGLEPDHLCRNRRCCNPYHMEPVTRSENTKRGDKPEANRRRAAGITHCPHGHPYETENTYFYRGSRHCKACKRERNAERYNRRRGSLLKTF